MPKFKQGKSKQERKAEVWQDEGEVEQVWTQQGCAGSHCMSAILEWELAEAAHNLSMLGAGWWPWGRSELQRGHCKWATPVMWEAGLELLRLLREEHEEH